MCNYKECPHHCETCIRMDKLSCPEYKKIMEKKKEEAEKKKAENKKCSSGCKHCKKCTGHCKGK